MTSVHAPTPQGDGNEREQPGCAPARSRTSTTRTRARAHTHDSDDGPWQAMAQTYAWVAEQERTRREKRNRTTAQWVLEQQIIYTPPQPQDAAWAALLGGFEGDAARWMAAEEGARRAALERERERRRRQAVQEEVGRAEARVRHRREGERQRAAAERARAHAEARERERRERARAEEAGAAAWRAYEAGWAQLGGGEGALGFGEIPWPVAGRVGPGGLTAARIVMFLFSGMGKGESRKERIRGAQLRWHPDRFRRVMVRVAEGDKAAVEEGVGVVARCLNDLKAREAVI